MPSKPDHVRKAELNVQFAKSLDLTDQASVDWALVALFYAAMHYVEAYLATIGRHLRSHATRDNWLGREANLRPIYREYAELKFFSYNARYEVAPFKAADVTADAMPSFELIRSHLKRFL